jgi:hypothetical protein
MYKPTTSFSFKTFFHSFPFCTCSETHSFIHRFFFYQFVHSCCYVSLNCYTKLCFLLSIQRFWRFTQNPVLCLDIDNKHSPYVSHNNPAAKGCSVVLADRQPHDLSECHKTENLFQTHFINI